jgi:hypothetical protein
VFFFPLKMSFKFDQIEIHTQKNRGKSLLVEKPKKPPEKSFEFSVRSFVRFFSVRSRSNVSSHEKYLRLFYLHLLKTSFRLLLSL